jgi:hypothetical protein
VCLTAAGALLAAGCGSSAHQDAHEPSGTFRMRVVRARFPTHQAMATPARLELQVRNTGLQTVPNVAVTLDSFYYTEHFPELASNKRPIWVIERGPGAIATPPVESQEVSQPGGGQTAYVNTWALGALPPGRTATFRWRVVPVKAGVHVVDYTVAAGLAGRAKVALGPGRPVTGRLPVIIAAAPVTTHVDPATGRVVVGVRPAMP